MAMRGPPCIGHAARIKADGDIDKGGGKCDHSAHIGLHRQLLRRRRLERRSSYADQSHRKHAARQTQERGSSCHSYHHAQRRDRHLLDGGERGIGTALRLAVGIALSLNLTASSRSLDSFVSFSSPKSTLCFSILVSSSFELLSASCRWSADDNSARRVKDGRLEAAPSTRRPSRPLPS